MSTLVFSIQEDDEFLEVRSCARWLDFRFNHHHRGAPAHFCVGLSYGEHMVVHEGHPVVGRKRGVLLFDKPRFLEAGREGPIWIAIGFEFEAGGHQGARIREVLFCVEAARPCTPECSVKEVRGLAQIRAALVGAMLAHDPDGRKTAVAEAGIDDPFDRAAFLLSAARDCYFRHRR